jgi:hypothetical protein
MLDGVRPGDGNIGGVLIEQAAISHPEPQGRVEPDDDGISSTTSHLPVLPVPPAQATVAEVGKDLVSYGCLAHCFGDYRVGPPHYAMTKTRTPPGRSGIPG